MATDSSSPYSFSMEDLLNLQDFELDLDDFTVGSPSSDSNSRSQRSDAGHTNPSTPSIAATTSYACEGNGCSCGAAFQRPSQLKKHVDQRTRPYACMREGCNVRPFSSKHDLGRHEREVHGQARAGGRVARLRCPHVSCKRHHRGFGRKENLALHIRTMHPDGSTSASSSEVASIHETSPASTAVAVDGAVEFAAPSPLFNATDMALQAALQDRLMFLQGHREALARQLQAVDEQIDAVQRTVGGLQGPTLGLELEFGGEVLSLK